jgi:hypothetical protein
MAGPWEDYAGGTTALAEPGPWEDHKPPWADYPGSTETTAAGEQQDIERQAAGTGAAQGLEQARVGVGKTVEHVRDFINEAAPGFLDQLTSPAITGTHYAPDPADPPLTATAKAAANFVSGVAEGVSSPAMVGSMVAGGVVPALAKPITAAFLADTAVHFPAAVDHVREVYANPKSTVQDRAEADLNLAGMIGITYALQSHLASPRAAAEAATRGAVAPRPDVPAADTLTEQPTGGEPPNAISQETISSPQIAGTETAARYQGPAAEAGAEPAAGASPQQQPADLAPAGDASYAAQQGGSPIPEGPQSPPGEAAASQSSLTPQGPLTYQPFEGLPAPPAAVDTALSQPPPAEAGLGAGAATTPNGATDIISPAVETPRPRSFRPDGGFSEDPLVAFVQDQGGILSKSSARQKWGAEKYAINASLWEDAPAFPDPRHNKVYNTKSGQPPDAIAQAAADAGLLPPAADASTLWSALQKTADSAHRTAKAERAQAASIATQEKQTRAFTAAAAKPSPGDKPISAFELSVGDTVKVGTETLKVRSVDPETYAVELEDGSKFGVQHVEDGTVFFGEHEPAKTGEKTNSETMKPGRGIPSGSGPTGEAAPHPGFLASESNTPTLRPGENQGDLLQGADAPFNLAGEKGIDYGARAAEELRKTQAAEAVAALAKKQQPNLFGPAVLEKLGLTREDLGAIGAVPHGTAQTALLIDRTRSMVRDIADVVGGRAAPKLTRAGALDEATQHAAARQYVPALIEDLLAKVFPDKYQDHAAMERTIDIIKKDNILGGYDDAVRELLRLNGTAGPTSAEAQAQAAFVKDIATAQNIPQLDAEVRASLNTDIAQDVKRWETHVSSLMDNLYNELKLANPGTPRETRGRHYAARMNLLPLHEEARISSFSDQNQPLPEIATSNYRNPNMKHDKFMRKAALTGEYSSDPTAVLLNSLGGRINEVTKLRFYQALERTGVGMIEDSFDPSITEIGGKPAARLPIKYPETDPKTGRTRMVEKSLYVQKELVPEIRGILNTDGRVTTNPILAAITKVQMLQLADASAHIKNIHSVVLNALGDGKAKTVGGVTTYSWLPDLLHKVPGLGSLLSVAEINSVARAVSADTPGMRSEIAFLARNGMIRPEYPSTGIQRITRMQDLIHTVDTASRVIMNRRFDQLVRRGLATDTLENRRNFIQQIGEYNRRLMSKKEVMLRDYGASPFIVAGRTFNRFARRLVTGNPRF